eukprot:TRINITY_DN69720_c0_g1_i1.p1 TRINITY_DN69720_c0_g1~~TRINITY_DN69720_c0_g1_i1.p1  ORF type:complete len:157 (-),score=29.08 TRINITY_DN69720_c0_g1_i1:71-541(-)
MMFEGRSTSKAFLDPGRAGSKISIFADDARPTTPSSLIAKTSQKIPAFADGGEMEEEAFQSCIDQCRRFDDRSFQKLCAEYDELDELSLAQALRDLRNRPEYHDSWLNFMVGGFSEQDMTPQFRGLILRDVAVEYSFRTRHGSCWPEGTFDISRPL